MCNVIAVLLLFVHIILLLLFLFFLFFQIQNSIWTITKKIKKCMCSIVVLVE